MENSRIKKFSPNPAKELVLRGERFVFFKTRQNSPVSVYKGRNNFLRIGPKVLIYPEIKYHEKLYSLRFPLAKILTQGIHNNLAYYIETSLGARHFGEIFKEDTDEIGEIKKFHFQKFLQITKKFAAAQLANTVQSDFSTFLHGIHFEEIIQELPHLSARLRRARDKLQNRLSVFPSVYTHYDFGPFNMFPGGITDLDRLHKGVFGYDVVSALAQTDFFPTSRGYELYRWFSFGKEQKQAFLKVFDELFSGNGLPPASDYYSDFTMCRGIWSSVRMHRWPKLQAWRYRQFQKLLAKYESS